MKDKHERSWGWFLLPVLAAGYLVVLAAKIAEAAMTSIFDEDE